MIDEKEIRREYARLICLAFPERFRVIRRRYWLRHLEENRRKSREKQAKDPNARRERYQSWCQANPQKIKYWIENNGARLANYRARTRALAAGAKISDSPKILAIYRRAQELRKWFDVLVDHIIPFSKGGSHEPNNLQIIYETENRKKHAKTDYIPLIVFQ